MRERSETDLTARIRSLPAVSPGPGVRERVLAAMAATQSHERPMSAADAKPRCRIAGRPTDAFAVAAGIAAIALLSTLFAISAGRFGEVPAGPQLAFVMPVDETVEPWVEASWVLERALDELPAQRRVMRVGTASTIAALETRIALIDERLGDISGGPRDPALTAALWRDRVDAMNALYQVRYGQSRRFEF